ncbi:N-acetylmuramoyl-L-alanine amidase [Jannaschia aquimarina]|uniref:N-acetylmuramoyl-L-alanine amidase n=1 Tax=Jannaschia aquimarina TaxID=935700 RepID=A0A0D1CRS5_9RHOB|nr:N-acetylmuramoyl-L-alanine amidase [Jannaschia aquimarina]KIT17507.1 N-acetylmuramoyl-L-alanine amidase AmiD precursor [Jannaschia aquimarina]SNS74217.1 N-acetylmuramoyl-L-alanine amidase [Jannaschia aquimarina]
MREAPSPNCGERRDGTVPHLILLHYTAMAGGVEPVIRWFQDPETQLSAHYVVGEDGEVVSMVPEDRRAWHAGAGRWGAITDVNSASIGIEICNAATHPFSARQMDAVEDLVSGIMDRHVIPPEGVIGHSDSAPGRKVDPGRRFDWRRLALSGLSVWPKPAAGPAPDQDGFRRDASTFGYTEEVPFETLLSAFRLRFRPGIEGPLDPVDMAMIADLARRWPAPALDGAPAAS